MELVAPVIEGFPLETDAMGMIVTDNYTTALEQTRAWLSLNRNFSIINDRY
jgi:hypothetical protein